MNTGIHERIEFDRRHRGNVVCPHSSLLNDHIVRSQNYSRSEYARIISLIEKGKMPPFKEHDSKLHKIGAHTISLDFPTLSQSHKKRINWYFSLEKIISDANHMNLLSNAIVHGSFGDLSFTEFSDLEITILLDGNILSNHKKIYELRKWIKKSLNPLILKIDPLQHHGPFYLWPSLINNYNEDILPLDAYNNCWSFETLHLDFALLDVGSACDSNPFYLTLHSIMNYERSFFKYGMTPFSIKRLLSNIMLLPAFFYQSKGMRYSKKIALNNMLALEIEPITIILTLSSNYRKEWKKPPAWLGWLRKEVVKARIPSGRLDLILTALYREKELQKSIKEELLPRLKYFCRTFKALEESYEL